MKYIHIIFLLYFTLMGERISSQKYSTFLHLGNSDYNVRISLTNVNIIITYLFLNAKTTRNQMKIKLIIYIYHIGNKHTKDNVRTMHMY